MIGFDVGGIESMGVVWDLIVTRVADNKFGPTGGEHVALALRGLVAAPGGWWRVGIRMRYLILV